jgi:hypothetical protein
MSSARMTIRSWMVVMLIVAFGSAAIPLALATMASLLDDVYQSARTHVEKSWSVRAPTKIIVDVFDGGIWVHPGQPGRVKAIVEPHCSCKNGSVQQAENALKVVDVEMTQEGDTIRVIAKQAGGSPMTCAVSTSTDLYLPPGSSLVLRTTTGSISVSGTPSEVVMENQIGATGANFEVGPGGAPKVDPTASARLEVVGGSVTVAGRSCGTVSPGDHVELTGDGRLYVNGIER